jgi:selenocysteine lyase/cysteine desulfurase
MTMSIDEFVARFEEEPGYLDFARMGPIGTTVLEEGAAQSTLLARSRFGGFANLLAQDARVREAVSALIRFPADQIVFTPNTSEGLLQAVFGLGGTVALSLGEFPSNTFAVVRAQEAIGSVQPLWLETDHGRVTPGTVKSQLTDETTAVMVSLVDFRTGFVADLEGIRQVIGDRLLIVDAIQGFTTVDAPFEVADVVVSGGQKWVRSGWGTGFLAMSDRAIERIRPVLSGFPATDVEGTPVDDVPPPTHGVGAFRISNPDPIAQARFAAALEEIAQVGVPVLAEHLAHRTTRLIDLADEFAIAVTSSRDEAERAGIVVLTPESDQLTVLTASLHNHGITSTTREGSVRLSPHVTTDEETFSMVRAAFLSFGAAINL